MNVAAIGKRPAPVAVDPPVLALLPRGPGVGLLIKSPCGNPFAKL